MSIRYDVEIALGVKGELPAQLGKVNDHLSRVDSRVNRLNTELGKVGKSLVSGFEGAVESVGSKLAGLGKVGIAAAVGTATYGVVSLNKELETTRVSLAAVLNANYLTDDITHGMEKAAGWVQQMKKDAADLPGEFQDLLYIVQSGAGAAFQAGLDEVKFERVASQAMAAGKAMSVNLKQTGRELAMLFEGRAGAHNVFGSRLGIHADGFNQKSAEERVKIIEDALERFQPAIAEFGKTFDAKSSTFADHVKTFVSTSTSGIFERVKDTLADANGWFENNRDTVQMWSGKVSDALVRAFDTGKAVIIEYWPAFKAFVENAYDRFNSIWTDAKPHIKEIGESMKAWMSGGKALDQIESILKLYVAAKVAGGAASFLGTMGGIGAAMGGGAGAAGAGAAAAGGGMGKALNFATTAGQAMNIGMGAGLLGYGAGAYLGGSEAGSMAGGALGGAASGATMAGPWGALAGGALGLGLGAYSAVSNVEERRQSTMEKHIASMVDSTANMDRYDAVVNEQAQTFGKLNTEGENFARMLRSITDIFGERGAQAFRVAAYERNAEIDEQRNQAAQQAIEQANRNALLSGDVSARSITGRTMQDKERQKQLHAAKGSGNTVIQKVEITVSSNQAPSQIARDVGKHLTQMKRYSTSSPDVFNASAGR